MDFSESSGEQSSLAYFLLKYMKELDYARDLTGKIGYMCPAEWLADAKSSSFDLEILLQPTLSKRYSDISIPETPKLIERLTKTSMESSQ